MWVNCLKTLNKLTMYLPGKPPSAPSVTSLQSAKLARRWLKIPQSRPIWLSNKMTHHLWGLWNVSFWPSILHVAIPLRSWLNILNSQRQWLSLMICWSVLYTLGARGHLSRGYIEDTLWFYNQFVQTLSRGYMLESFTKYPPLWSQCKQWSHAD